MNQIIQLLLLVGCGVIAVVVIGVVVQLLMKKDKENRDK
jgi:hypothetical protein